MIIEYPNSFLDLIALNFTFSAFRSCKSLITLSMLDFYQPITTQTHGFNFSPQASIRISVPYSVIPYCIFHLHPIVLHTRPVAGLPLTRIHEFSLLSSCSDPTNLSFFFSIHAMVHFYDVDLRFRGIFGSPFSPSSPPCSLFLLVLVIRSL